ncbi:MAG: hypothetical protein GX267_03800 [Fibrobacter sp.]|jgi:hypothetical protein|nr:hypothetical protein [Fibrobacter sp.]NLL12508.1 hypothetical protein [Fibrobacter sp.]
MSRNAIIMLVCLSIFSVSAQDQSAYTSSSEQTGNSLFDPSRLSIQHSLSFGMASASGVSDLKSQSLYTTMLQYKFAAPVTINLNFSLPIHSTFSSSQNFTPNNLSSMEYFKNVPFNFSINWQPTQNMIFHFNVSRITASSYFWDDYYNGYHGFRYFGFPYRDPF